MAHVRQFFRPLTTNGSKGPAGRATGLREAVELRFHGLDSRKQAWHQKASSKS
jgi:hypothetical protein